MSRDNASAHPSNLSVAHSGLTIREYFAGRALQGILASGNVVQGFGTAETTRIRVACEAVACADAVLEALAGEHGPPPAERELALERALLRVKAQLHRMLLIGEQNPSAEHLRAIARDCLDEVYEAPAPRA